MKKSKRELDALIDSTAARIRDEEIPHRLVEDAASNVWAKLTRLDAHGASVEQTVALDGIQGCADYQTLIPAYLRGELSVARKLLLEDHTGECVPCRRALKEARTGATANATADVRRPPVYAQPKFGSQFGIANARPSSVFARNAMAFGGWRAAAAVIISFALIGLLVLQPFGGKNFGGVVQAADGIVYRVANEESRTLGAGAAVGANEKIRTARDAHASLKLEDGTKLEMRERSQFSLIENRRGATIEVERGHFIVETPADDTELYVATDDALVHANGATLAVASGTKGTRVSVISGAATVDSNGNTKRLSAGEQFTSRANLSDVSLSDDVSWSREATRYDKIIDDLRAAGADVNARTERPGVRHSTRLLDLAPADTSLYVALPNWSRTLADARGILQERMNANPALRGWWQERNTARQGSGANFDTVLERVGAWGERLKDEIVVTVSPDAAGTNANGNNKSPERVLLLTEVKDPADFRNFIAEQIAEFDTNGTAQPRVRLIDDPSTVTANDTTSGATKNATEIFVWLHNDIVAVSPQASLLRELSGRLNANAVTAQTQNFVGSELHNRLAGLYREGTSLIVAVDLEQVINDEITRDDANRKDEAERQAERAALRLTGFDGVRYFVVESKDARDLTMNRAVLSFDGERHGMAAWLASPAPMGALDLISPEASVAAAFVVKDPAAVVDDMFGFLKANDSAMWNMLSDAQAAHGIDIRRDIAAPLGGEFAFAVDGPLLPTPSWKLIFETHDPARLNATFERLVGEANKVAARENKRGFTFEREEAGGRTFYTIKSLDFGLSAEYTYADNYLVMTPSRALLERTLRFRDAGMTLAGASRFTASLPADGDANFSALFYQNLGGVLAPVARTMRGYGKSSGETKRDEGRTAIETLDTLSPPALAYARADATSITFAAPTKGGPFGVTPSTLLGLPGDFALGDLLEEGTRGGQ